MEPASLRRRIDLDVSIDQLWELVSDPSSLAQWLGDCVDIDVRPGGVGAIVDDGVTRFVHVDRYEHGRSIGFSWWEAGQPERGSRVEFEIVEQGDGGSRLEITETFTPVPTDYESSATVAMSQSRWEARVCALWACTVVAALIA